jgi:hypothetical protein
MPLTAKEMRLLKRKNPRLKELPRRTGEALDAWLARLREMAPEADPKNWTEEGSALWAFWRRTAERLLAERRAA